MHQHHRIPLAAAFRLPRAPGQRRAPGGAEVGGRSGQAAAAGLKAAGLKQAATARRQHPLTAAVLQPGGGAAGGVGLALHRPQQPHPFPFGEGQRLQILHTALPFGRPQAELPQPVPLRLHQPGAQVGEGILLAARLLAGHRCSWLGHRPPDQRRQG